MRKIYLLFLVAVMAIITSASYADPTVVMIEDFSGETNIFGVTNTEGAAGKAFINDTGLTGLGKVLAVCNTYVEGTIKGTDGQPVSCGSDGTVTVEWTALQGYFGNARNTTVSLLNSGGDALASYIFNCSTGQITDVKIGGQTAPGFEAFAMRSTGNGFGGNGRPYTAGTNPEISVTMTARGGLGITFSVNGSSKTFNGTVGTMTKDVAKIAIESKIENTDRCFAIDNITVSTDKLTQDENYVEAIVSATLVGSDKMTFGPSTDEAYANEYSVLLVGEEGTTITEANISPKVTDFKVTWDIEGFKTENDQEGQYCDSYGAFATNDAASVKNVFNLRDVPMNFYGRMTATITYNGKTFKAQKYVVALGNTTQGASQILPVAGYPQNFSSYPAALVGYKVASSTYGGLSDLILGGWCTAGSDGDATAILSSDNDGTRYVRYTSKNLKKSHVFTSSIESPTGQVIFAMRLRFNNSGATVTLTGGYPFWSSSKYTCPVSLNFDGSKLLLNGTALTLNSAAAAIETGKWYDIILSADKSGENCYAQAYNTAGELVGQSGTLAWAETSTPTYFNIGMGNSDLGSIDVAACQAYIPTADASTYTLAADKTTLSIPQGEQAVLTASLNDADGYPVTGKATWTVLEEDMQAYVIVTPDAADSHKATVTLAEGAEAGTATIQVNIGGNSKSIALSLTSLAESIRFTESTTSISIPMDKELTATETFSAIVINGEGTDMQRTVTLAAFEKDGSTPYINNSGISFDAATGKLTVTSAAAPTQIVIRATGQNSEGKELTKSVKVDIHGLTFDFGTADEGAVAEGFTAVTSYTTYSAANGYGIYSGTSAAGGTPSATDAKSDYLEGAVQFNVKVQKGEFYTVEITYQGTLTTAHINSDLAGYTLGTHATMDTETYTIPATRDYIDLHIAAADATSVARIAQISITKQAKRQKRGKRVVHHIGDSTSANNGSWAYRLKNIIGTEYPELEELCTFHNDGAGGRNLATYYTQGKLASVLNDIYPGDILMLGNMGTNGMGNSFEADANYYLNAAEALGAQVILNSYTPHGAVSNYSGGYSSTTNTFDSYRKDSYDVTIRKIAASRATSDDNFLGFVEIGRNADAIFNAYVKDYAANGYNSANEAAQAIIKCFTDHNHYSNGTLACNLMLGGYKTTSVKGIVAQMVDLLSAEQGGSGEEPGTGIVNVNGNAGRNANVYNLNGQKTTIPSVKTGQIYIVDGRKILH